VEYALQNRKIRGLIWLKTQQPEIPSLSGEGILMVRLNKEV